MYKFMVLLLAIVGSNAYAQHQSEVTETLQETLYPYRDKEGQFGYADDHLQIRIKPQYKMAGLFTKHGFAVITDSLGRKGIIDKTNRIVLVPEYNNIRLHSLADFTLAEVFTSYYTRWRFWKWKFLPGFNLAGSGSDNRLFDTKVKQLRKSVYILGDKIRKIKSKRLTDEGYTDTYFNIKILDKNRILIDGQLYEIRPGGARIIASDIIGPLSESTLAQEKGKHLNIINLQGKRLNSKGYTFQDTIKFKVENIPIRKRLTRDRFRPIASAYGDGDGQTYIYPDFSKPFPWLIHDNILPHNPTVEELIGGLWTLVPVGDSEYFFLMSYRDGGCFFRFLDTLGNWHRTLPPGILFRIVQPSGDIVWPPKEQIIPRINVPKNWKIDRISALSDSSKYRITFFRNKLMRQGIWDVDQQEWLIAPEYYEVYPMDNNRYYRYHSEYDGLWGIMDHNGKILIKPSYYFIHPDGWVTKKEHGKKISFYFHLPTLKEFRKTIK